MSTNKQNVHVIKDARCVSPFFELLIPVCQFMEQERRIKCMQMGQSFIHKMQKMQGRTPFEDHHTLITPLLNNRQYSQSQSHFLLLQPPSRLIPIKVKLPYTYTSD